jgi:chaperonin cofactor prefoldin
VLNHLSLNSRRCTLAGRVRLLCVRVQLTSSHRYQSNMSLDIAQISGAFEQIKALGQITSMASMLNNGMPSNAAQPWEQGWQQGKGKGGGSRSGRGRGGKGACFICGDPNHWVESCPKNQANTMGLAQPTSTSTNAITKEGIQAMIFEAMAAVGKQSAQLPTSTVQAEVGPTMEAEAWSTITDKLSELETKVMCLETTNADLKAKHQSLMAIIKSQASQLKMLQTSAANVESGNTAYQVSKAKLTAEINRVEAKASREHVALRSRVASLETQSESMKEAIAKLPAAGKQPPPKATPASKKKTEATGGEPAVATAARSSARKPRGKTQRQEVEEVLQEQRDQSWADAVEAEEAAAAEEEAPKPQRSSKRRRSGSLSPRAGGQ